MLHALHRSKEVISKEIELNTFIQIYFIHMNSSEIDVQQIYSSDNLEDLFTNSFPTSTIKKLINKIGMR